ncbi:ABC transporter substrate-binding protein [Desulfobacterales bacterium HSG2]|nr:ABC transporter substrate-binding protein [Desulfobacterales bacterium HSG2]
MKKALLFIICFFGVCVSHPGISAEPIKIAAIFAKTGDAKISTVQCFRGVSLGVEEINAQGGLMGRQIQLVELDNKSNAIGAKIAALNAVRQNVIAVIGASWSSHSLAMAPVLQKAGIPMISPESTNPEVTREGDYIFRVCFIDPFQGKVMAQFAFQDLEARTAAILKNVNSDYSTGLSRYFKDSFLGSGGKIMTEEKYLAEATDFTGFLQKIKELKPDVVFAPGYERDSSLLLKQAGKIGVQSVFLGGDGWSETVRKLAGQAAEGHYFSSHWHSDVPFPASKALMKNYHRKHSGELIVASAPLTYDAIMVLAHAIRSAQSSEPRKIRDALASTKDFQGTTGTIRFDENGDPLDKDAVILKFDKGKTVFVKTIKP